MCTVTAIRTKDKFFITSNRDEEPHRNAIGLRDSYSLFGKKIVFPEEPSHGGTWIAVSEDKRVSCLLNGAFFPYELGGSYRTSRGIVLLKSFDFDHAEKFAHEFQFEDIAPFTMVLYQDEQLFELIWDGIDVHFSEVSNSYSIWSSVQLYKPATRIDKKTRFETWANTHSNFETSAIMNFHLEGHPDFLIDNKRVKTISVSSVQLETGSPVLTHKDLVEDRILSFDFN